MGSYPSSSSTNCSMYPSYYNLSTFPTPTCGSQWTAFSASIWYRERSWTVLESNGEEYLLRYTIVRSTYYFCLISIPIPTFSLSSRHPPRPGLLHPQFPRVRYQGHMEALDAAAARTKMDIRLLWWWWLCPSSLLSSPSPKLISTVASGRRKDNCMWITKPEYSL